MSWALPFMFIPLAVMIPCSIVAFFEFWQDTEISDARNKLIRQVQKVQLLQEKLIRAELLPVLFKNSVQLNNPL
jgi:hypothetical protein